MLGSLHLAYRTRLFGDSVGLSIRIICTVSRLKLLNLLRVGALALNLADLDSLVDASRVIKRQFCLDSIGAANHLVLVSLASGLWAF